MKELKILIGIILWFTGLALGAQESARYIFGHNSFLHRPSVPAPGLSAGKAIKINVMGEVAAPGIYTLAAGATLFDALSAASGLTPIGSLREVELWRNNKLTLKADLYQYLMLGDTASNPRLNEGDLLIVPSASCLVQVRGAVKRPMYYEALPEENINHILAHAGSLRQGGCEQWIQVVRAEDNGRKIFSLDSLERKRFKLSHGDIVIAESPTKHFLNRVDISGAVMRPGSYQQGAGGDTTVVQLLKSAGELDNGAFTERVLLYREQQGFLKILPLNLQAILDGTQPDMRLQKNDVLHIPYRQEIRSEHEISVFGAVRSPGTFRYAEQMSVADAILLAGGLEDAAMASSVEIVRRPRDAKVLSRPAGQMQFSSFTVSLSIDLREMGDTVFRLQPFDEIYVRKAPHNVAQRHASISGEVQYPGVYVLAEKNWSLTDLLKAAGGPTASAYLPDAVLQRQLNLWERKVLENYRQELGDDYIEGHFSPLGLPYKRIQTSLEEAICSPENPNKNLQLQEGDHLIVPHYSPTVSVYGEVVSPSSVIWVKGKGLNYYIDRSGGYTYKAQRKRAFVVYPNGGASHLKHASDIRPGCTIFVPSRSFHKRVISSDIDPLFLLNLVFGSYNNISNMVH